MSKEVYSLAFDFGASSGRAILSKFDGEKIELQEIYRFPNEPVKMGGDFYWDFPRLFLELKNGLKKAAKMGVTISSIGIDTWGVDYGLLDKNGKLLALPYHYRDDRTDDMLKRIEKVMSYDEIYNITGIQYMQFNTLYQLFSDLTYRPEILKQAKTMLFMPDLFSYFLTGNKFSEYSIASTAQMLDAKQKEWAYGLLERLELPTDILQKLIMPGSVYGTLSEEIQKECGLGKVTVVAVGAHDTASAVAGTPFTEGNKVFLSCGTWSLLGMEKAEPVITDRSLEYSFTNEGGVDNTIRLLKNINGTFILQQLRKSWSENIENISFPDIIKAAQQNMEKPYIIDPNDKSFMDPLNMAEAIQDYCESKGQGRPESLGEIAISVYNGLTSEYKTVIEKLEKICEDKIECVNMIGGGIQDEFLCQLTSDVTGRKIIAGPTEASAFGNVIMQLKALGEVVSLAEGREFIKKSVEIKTFVPKN